MIKSLFGEDEEESVKPEPETSVKQENLPENSAEEREILTDVSKSGIGKQNNVVAEDKIKTEDEIETIDEIRTAIETGQIPERNNESVKPFEIKRPIGQPQSERKVEEKISDSAKNQDTYIKSEKELELERKLAEIEAELLAEKEYQNKIGENQKVFEESKKASESEQIKKEIELQNLVNQSADLPLEKKSESGKGTQIKASDDQKIHISQKDFKPESKAEMIRNSGLAWSAAIALFGSIVFMMILGWFADTFLDSSPWGITVGILIGAIVGFAQFFRMTSQIINPKPNDFEKVSLYSNLNTAKPEITENMSAPETALEDKNTSKNKPDESKTNEDILEIK